MPGSVKVSVLEAEHLPCTVKDGHLVSIRVSVGKREYQTKPSQAFGGQTPSWKYVFSYPVTNLRDNLMIAAVDSNEEVITKSEIQTHAIIQRGFWDGFFSFKGGGRLHLKLYFSLSDEERKKVELMRLEALRRKGLQNLLYRSTYQMPKPVSVRPTKSFVSTVTITEIPSDSCLYVKDNENKENHGNIASSLRCPKLLDAPKEKNLLLEGSLPVIALKPLAVQCKSTNAVLQPEQPCNSPSDLCDTQNKNLPVPFVLNVGETPETALVSKHDREISRELPSIKQAISADSEVAENESSLLLPQASAFMGDLSDSGTVSRFGYPNSTNFNLVPMVIPCETVATVEAANATVEAANMESASMPASNVSLPSSKIQPNMKPIPDLVPYSNVSSAVTATPLPLAAEYSGSAPDLKTGEDLSSFEAVPGAKTPDNIEMTEATQVTETLGTFIAETCPFALQSTVMEQSCIEDATGLLNAPQTTLEVDELESSEKMQAVEQSEHAAVKDVAKKLEFDKGVEDGRRTTSAFENAKLLKNLPWKSQAKGASEKFEWLVNKKRRTENEHHLLFTKNPQLAESADSEKANTINENEESNRSVYGWVSAILQPNGRIKKWISVALLLAGVIILGSDAIQRDLASKKDSYAGKQGNKRHISPSSQMDDSNITKNSSIYHGQRIGL